MQAEVPSQKKAPVYPTLLGLLLVLLTAGAVSPEDVLAILLDAWHSLKSPIWGDLLLNIQDRGVTLRSVNS